MKRFVAEADRGQWTLLPECLDDFIDESNPVRVVDAFVAALDLAALGFDGVAPATTGRPAYHPSTQAAVAIANKTARIAWAIMVHGGVYDAAHRAPQCRAEACAATK